MKLRYFGHSAFSIEHEGHVVLTDPFLSSGPVGKIPEDLKPTSLMLTHGHGDHVGDAVELSKKHKVSVFAMFELSNLLEKEGALVTHGGFGGRVKHDWGWSKFVPAWHSSSYNDQYTGNPAGIVFEIGGRVFYNTGDTCVFSDMKLIAELYKPEIMLLPIGGTYTMDLFEAVKAVELVSPRFAIPVHYNTFPPIQQDPEEFRQAVESRLSTRVQVLKTLETWEVPSAVNAR